MRQETRVHRERHHDPERLEIYTLAWKGDQALPANAPREGTAHLHCRVFLNGEEIKCAIAARLNYAGGEFASVQVDLTPSSVKVVECDAAEWEALSSSGASA